MLLNAYGQQVPDSDAAYLAVHAGPFMGGDIWLPNPNYKGPSGGGGGGGGQAQNQPLRGSTAAPAPTPTAFQFTFDTIGQVIYRTLGHVRLPLRVIWVQGIVGAVDQLTTVADAVAGDTVLVFDAVPPWMVPGVGVVNQAITPGTTILSTTATTISLNAEITDDIVSGSVIDFSVPAGQTVSPTATIALALGSPIDPEELGTFETLYIGGQPVFSASGGIVPPPAWAVTDQAQLIASLLGMQLYPGDEAQLPAPLIVADKGAGLTNAFRHIRYIILPGFPLHTGALTQLSLEFRRTNTLPPPPPPPQKKGNIIAVEFAAGAG